MSRPSSTSLTLFVVSFLSLCTNDRGERSKLRRNSETISPFSSAVTVFSTTFISTLKMGVFSATDTFRTLLATSTFARWIVCPKLGDAQTAVSVPHLPARTSLSGAECGGERVPDTARREDGLHHGVDQQHSALAVAEYFRTSFNSACEKSFLANGTMLLVTIDPHLPNAEGMFSRYRSLRVLASILSERGHYPGRGSTRIDLSASSVINGRTRRSKLRREGPLPGVTYTNWAICVVSLGQYSVDE
jgi:hypothetical protein